MTASITASMWEVVAAPGCADALVRWVFDEALPDLEDPDDLVRSEVYRSSDDRVVVITWWSEEPIGLVDPPPELVAHPPQSWEFEQVTR
ncbi:MAG: hypothetical protein ACRDPT_01805 [Streptomycetales bacterium]